LSSLPFTFLLPLPMKIAVDSVLGGKPLPSALVGLQQTWMSSPNMILLLACLTTLLTIGLHATLAQGTRLYEQFIWESLVMNLRIKLFRHIQSLSFRFHGDKGAASLFYNLENDVRNMQSISIQGLIPLCTSGIVFTVMLYITLRIDWQLAILALGVLPVLGLVGHWYAKKSKLKWSQVKVSENQALAALQESLGRVSTIQYFGQQEREVESYREAAGLYLKQFMSAIQIESIYSMSIAFVFALVTAASLYIGIHHVQNGLLSLGNFLVVSAYLVQLMRPLEIFSSQIAAIQVSLASARRVFSVLDEVPEIKSPTRARPLGIARGDFEFDSVSFSYGRGGEALKNINFSVRAGMTVAIVGPTGAGKSTLIALLGRFIDPSNGTIRLDGVDVRELDLEILRRQFAYVPQEPVLIKGTIASNIAYGRAHATREEIEAAATAAGASEFIAKLPLGYETRIGDRGHSLSGGERQRIALAMAYLTDAPILVLDEATSALDLATEVSIARALAKIRRGRTAFVISHRQSFIQNFDLILELNRGQLVRVSTDNPCTETIQGLAEI
jgi:ATP-binding cassette subfamily B protein